MSSIIPYAAQELAKPQNAALALDLFTEAGKAAHGMYQAHKVRRQSKFKQAKGRTKQRGLADLGHDPTKGEPRRNTRESGVVTQNNKQMYTEKLIEIEKNVAADEAINKRSRDVILHKGSKVCFTVKSRLKVPVFFNLAWVIPKAANTVNPVDILRGQTVERDSQLDNTLSFMDLRCLPINTDLYRIVKHKKMMILPDSDKSATVSEGRDFRLVEEYIKTNRKIYFNGSTSTPLQNVHMVWWCDYYNSPTGVNSATVDISWRIVDYFADVP